MEDTSAVAAASAPDTPELHRARQFILHLQTSRDALHASLDSFKTLAENEKTLAGIARRQLAQRNADIAQLQESTAVAAAVAATQLEERDACIIDLRARLDERDASTATEITDKDACITDLRTRLDHTSSQLADRDACITDLRTRIDDRDSQLADRDACITDLRTHLDDSASQLQDRDDSITDLRARLDDSASQLEDRDACITDLRSQLHRVSAIYDEQEEDQSAAELDLETIDEKQIQNKFKEARVARKVIKAKSSTIDHLQAQVDSLTHQNSQHQTECTQLKQSLNDLKEQNISHESNSHQLNLQIEQLRKQLPVANERNEVTAEVHTDTVSGSTTNGEIENRTEIESSNEVQLSVDSEGDETNCAPPQETSDKPELSLQADDQQRSEENTGVSKEGQSQKHKTEELQETTVDEVTDENEQQNCEESAVEHTRELDVENKEQNGDVETGEKPALELQEEAEKSSEDAIELETEQPSEESVKITEHNENSAEEQDEEEQDSVSSPKVKQLRVLLSSSRQEILRLRQQLTIATANNKRNNDSGDEDEDEEEDSMQNSDNSNRILGNANNQLDNNIDDKTGSPCSSDGNNNLIRSDSDNLYSLADLEAAQSSSPADGSTLTVLRTGHTLTSSNSIEAYHMEASGQSPQVEQKSRRSNNKDKNRILALQDGLDSMERELTGKIRECKGMESHIESLLKPKIEELKGENSNLHNMRMKLEQDLSKMNEEYEELQSGYTKVTEENQLNEQEKTEYKQQIEEFKNVTLVNKQKEIEELQNECEHRKNALLFLNDKLEKFEKENLVNELRENEMNLVKNVQYLKEKLNIERDLRVVSETRAIRKDSILYETQRNYNELIQKHMVTSKNLKRNKEILENLQKELKDLKQALLLNEEISNENNQIQVTKINELNEIIKKHEYNMNLLNEKIRNYYEKELHKLNQLVNDQKHEIQTLQLNLKESSENEHKLNTQLHNELEAKQLMQYQLQENDHQMEKLRVRLTTSQNEVINTTSQAEALGMSLADCQQHVEQAESTIRQMQNKVDQLEKEREVRALEEVQKRQKQKEEAKEKEDSETSANKKLDAHTEKLFVDKCKDVKRLTECLRQADGRLRQMETSVKNIRKEVKQKDELLANQRDLNGQLGKLEAEKTGIQLELSAEKEANTGLRTQLDTLRAEYAQLESSSSDKSALHEKEAALAKLQAWCETLNSKLSKSEERLAKRESELCVNNEAVKRLQLQLHELGSRLKAKDAAERQLRQKYDIQIACLNSRIDTLTLTIRQFEQQEDSSAGEDRTYIELSQLRTRLRLREMDFSDVKARNEILQRHVEEYECDIAKSQRRTDDLTNEIRQMQVLLGKQHLDDVVQAKNPSDSASDAVEVYSAEDVLLMELKKMEKQQYKSKQIANEHQLTLNPFQPQRQSQPQQTSGTSSNIPTSISSSALSHSKLQHKDIINNGNAVGKVQHVAPATKTNDGRMMHHSSSFSLPRSSEVQLLRSLCTVTFILKVPLHSGLSHRARLFIVGSDITLGQWQEQHKITLSNTDHGQHNMLIAKCEIVVPAEVNSGYKYIADEGNGQLLWESGDNRTLRINGETCKQIEDEWRGRK